MRNLNGLSLLLILAASTTLSAENGKTQSSDQTMDKKDPAAILLAVDQAFSDRAQEADVPTAFVEYAAEDAVMYRNGMEPVMGKASIAELMAGENGVKLVWKPLTADIAASGDLGYTRGSFVFYTAPGEDGSPPKGPYEGYYLSIWKRQADGSWKWVYDGGIISKTP